MDNSASSLKTLCNGNAPDRTWTMDDAGRWVPSLHDRRRLVAARLTRVLETQGFVSGHDVEQSFRFNSTSLPDFHALADNFNRWNNTPPKP